MRDVQITLKFQVAEGITHPAEWDWEMMLNTRDVEVVSYVIQNATGNREEMDNGVTTTSGPRDWEQRVREFNEAVDRTISEDDVGPFDSDAPEPDPYFVVVEALVDGNRVSVPLTRSTVTDRLPRRARDRAYAASADFRLRQLYPFAVIGYPDIYPLASDDDGPVELVCSCDKPTTECPVHDAPEDN